MDFKTRRKRPQHLGGQLAVWESEPFLTTRQRGDLSELLPKSMKTEERGAFLDECNACCNRVRVAMRTPNAEAAERFEKVCAAARKLQVALEAVQPFEAAELAMFEAVAMHERQLPGYVLPFLGTSLGQGLMPMAWEFAVAVEVVADAATVSRKKNIDKNDRPAVAMGRQLAREVVSAYFRIFGKAPANSQRSGFVEFMRLLGGYVGAPCGPTLVKEAVQMAISPKKT